MSAGILAKGQKIGLLKQAAWDTPATASGDFITMFYNAGGTTPEPDVQQDQFNIADGGNVMDQYIRVNTDGVSGMPSINFAGPATKLTTAAHMASVFQSVAEAATTPYAKTYTFADSVLDWYGDEGYVHTLAIDTGVAATDIILENAILNNYSFKVNTLGRGLERYATHEGTWMGNEMNYGQTLSGSWSTPAASPTFYNTTAAPFEGSLASVIGSTTLAAGNCFHNFEFRYNANLSSNCKTAGGKANNYRWKPEAFFVIDYEYNSTTAPILEEYKKGTRAYVSAFNNGISTGTDGNLSFTNDYGVLAENPYIYDGDYVALRVTIKLLSPAAGWGTIVTLTDTLDGGY